MDNELPIVKYIMAAAMGRNKLDLPLSLHESLREGHSDAKIFSLITARQEGNLCILHYNNRVKRDDWDKYEGALHECCGLVIDTKFMNVVLRPYPKVFSIGQRPETMREIIRQKIAGAAKVEYAEKMDGVLICGRVYNGKVILSTSDTIDPTLSPQLACALRYIEADGSYRAMMNNFPEYTFMFELIDPEFSHIVDYPSRGYAPGLYLHGMRNVATGKCYPFRAIAAIADAYKIPHVSYIENSTLEIIEEDNKATSARKSAGYIANIDGYLVELKNENYIKYKDEMQAISENAVLRGIAGGPLDIGMSKYHGTSLERWIEKVNSEAQEYMAMLKRAVNITCAQYSDLARKDFFIAMKNVPVPVSNYAAAEYLHKEYNPLKRGPKGSEHYVTYPEMLQYKKFVKAYLERVAT